MAPVATTDDVRALVETDLTGTQIQPWLELTAREIDRTYDATDFVDAAHRADFEAALTAYRIISGLDRRPETISHADSRISYGDESEVAFLSSLVKRLDPGSEFSVGGVVRDSDRNAGSANNPRDDDRIKRSNET